MIGIMQTKLKLEKQNRSNNFSMIKQKKSIYDLVKKSNQSKSKGQQPIVESVPEVTFSSLVHNMGRRMDAERGKASALSKDKAPLKKIINKSIDNQQIKQNIRSLEFINKEDLSSSCSEKIKHDRSVAELEGLAEKPSVLQIPSEFFDSLPGVIGDAQAYSFYLYLWRRTIGLNKESAEISLYILSKFFGVSLKCTQRCFKILHAKGLVKTTALTGTASRHVISLDWMPGF
jgi:hypothetical protein